MRTFPWALEASSRALLFAISPFVKLVGVKHLSGVRAFRIRMPRVKSLKESVRLTADSIFQVISDKHGTLT